ncbi:MAG: SGNH/GDSL hydrolase family protein [Smithella sp.]|nr:SGNH/GDSL hydrolase family protein [Smithella sp.]
MSKGHIKQYFIVFLITITLLYVCLELYARYQVKYGRSGNEVKILYAEKFPEIDNFLADKRLATDAGLTYYDYFLFAIAPTPEKSKLVRFTDYYSARYVPESESLGSGAPIIWIFGGSTIQNMETTDELSIANQIAVSLKNSGRSAAVVNFGVGGFQSSLESIKFQELLRQVPAAERPQVVVFYDGFNDAGVATRLRAGSYQNDLVMKIETLVEGHHGKMFFYSLGNLVGRISVYWRNRLAFKYADALFGGKYIKYDRDNMIKGVEIYETNSRIIRGVCREFGIKPVFLLQPMIFTKADLTEFEKSISLPPDNRKMVFMTEFYRLAGQAMKKYDDFYNLSDILNGSERNDFYDLGHTGPYTGIAIGEHIGKILMPYLADTNKTAGKPFN